LSLSSRVVSGAGSKGGIWASRRLGQATTILTVSLRKGDVSGREEQYSHENWPGSKTVLKLSDLDL